MTADSSASKRPNKLVTVFRGLPLWGKLASIITLLFLVGLVDYLTGYQVHFGIFYLGPILIATWEIGRRSGMAFSAIAAVCWFAADHLSRHQADFPLVIIFWNAAVRLGFFTIVVLSFSRIKKSLVDEHVLSRTDPLTGIPNRLAMIERATLELERQGRTNSTLTMAYVDLDNFKHVNDDFGHQRGDMVLKEIACLLLDNTRRTDLAARMGGDEFAVLFPETGEKEAAEIMSRIADKLAALMDREGWGVTLSAGAVTFDRPAQSVSELIDKADVLMYEVKKAGKNAIRSMTMESNK